MNARTITNRLYRSDNQFTTIVRSKRVYMMRALKGIELDLTMSFTQGPFVSSRLNT